MHGKTSPVLHKGDGVFAGLPQPLTATRYHSLIAERETLPDCLEITAWLEDDTITFDICRALVDRWVDISELEIARAVASMVDDHHHLVEGAAGVALAAATPFADTHPGTRVVAVSCGANVGAASLEAMLAMANR